MAAQRTTRASMLGSFSNEDRKPGPLDRRRSLDAVPTRATRIEERCTAGGGVLLTARFERRRGALSRWLPPTVEKRVELDELGAQVFGLIDGTRTVGQIIEAFRSAHRLNRREAELSVVAFLRSLAGRRMIVIVLP